MFAAENAQLVSQAASLYGPSPRSATNKLYCRWTVYGSGAQKMRSYFEDPASLAAATSCSSLVAASPRAAAASLLPYVMLHPYKKPFSFPVLSAFRYAR